MDKRCQKDRAVPRTSMHSSCTWYTAASGIILAHTKVPFIRQRTSTSRQLIISMQSNRQQFTCIWMLTLSKTLLSRSNDTIPEFNATKQLQSASNHMIQAYPYSPKPRVQTQESMHHSARSWRSDNQNSNCSKWTQALTINSNVAVKNPEIGSQRRSMPGGTYASSEPEVHNRDSHQVAR